MAHSYKVLKEHFVSNLTGGDVLEINLVTAVAPAAVLLWSALQSRQTFFHRYGPEAAAADFLLNVGAILLATTLYSEYPTLLTALLIGPSLLLLAIVRPAAAPKRAARPAPPSNDGLDQLPVRPFLTAYRGAMMVVTCVAILAVDFPVFPRRFAKVETWGTSVMDMGVGSFVFSAGTVAARPVLKDRIAGKSTGAGRRLYASARHAIPLLVLALVRLYSVKGLDYAEHVSEYGVHWNFFFTLALLSPFVALCRSVFALIPSYAALALVLGISYQVVLESTNLKAYILTAPRTDLLSQNREGIFSLFGYLAIFLAGQATGMYIIPRQITSLPPSRKSTTTDRRRMLVQLGAWSIAWNALFFVVYSKKYGLDVDISRRLANLPYILWVVAFNCTQILAFCLIETAVFPAVYAATDTVSERAEADRATSRILRSYNRNGLAVFLVANLLTGAINLTVKTLDMGTREAMAILVGYLLLLTTLAVVLDARDISIKI